MNFTVEFSTKHEQEFGTFFQSKLVHKSEDELLGIETKQTYYLWGKKQLTGTIDMDIDNYVVVQKEVPVQTEEGPKLVTLKQIVGLK
jgi:CO dehydrogenase/acetyl-CoA synthase alpha subunit